ncbi:MAG: tRNA (adenine(22)-N(1))-methyltransferase TrmK [Candidatus Izimaplasma sp.]|nr:tRNA (adenine(22)-N(1))-methyltransferase TrmK [Candidatus Izimaplasma bacterium]
MRLSKRLEICLKYVDGFHNLADIGTDHAKVPIEAVLRGYVMKAQAIDNKHGPYVIAYSNVKKAELLDRIQVKRADGLSDISNDTDVAIISGMGGLTIQKILQDSDLKQLKRIVIQANDNEEAIRKSLQNINFKIVDELVFADKEKLYGVIVVEPGNERLSTLECAFGPINLRQQPYYFTKKIKKELDYITTVIDNLTDATKHPDLLQRQQDLKEALMWKETT